MTKHDWPTREDWAKRRQHPYWDCETGCPFADRYSHRLSDYATPEEIAAAVAALENLWRQHGRKMRELKLKGSRLYQQPDEEERSLSRRIYAMSKADMDMACEPDTLKGYRRGIKKALAILREGSVADLRGSSAARRGLARGDLSNLCGCRPNHLAGYQPIALRSRRKI